ncbi:MAG: phosphate/phosphite/phosphonate ABC transporter substrate-binding protein [bacterium]
MVFVFIVAIAGCGNGGEEVRQRENDSSRVTINYGHVPSVATSEKYDQLLPLRNYLENELDINFEIKFAEDYETVIDRVKDGEYDFITFGPLSYVLAADQGLVDASLKPLRHGGDSYKSLIIVHEDSDINKIDDLRNKSFGFVDRRSTSGHLFPRAFLQKKGIDVESELQYSFLGNHNNVVINVWLQEYDAGAIYDDAREHSDNSDMVLKQTRILAETPAIPNEPWAFSREFKREHPELVENIIAIMKKLHREGARGKKILDRQNIDGFTAAADTDYQVIREYQEYLPDVEP